MADAVNGTGKTGKAEDKRDLDVARIRYVDSKTLTPEQRAERLLIVLRKHVSPLEPYDLLCLGVELSAASAADYTWLRESAKQAVRLLYNAHYLASEEMGLIK